MRAARAPRPRRDDARLLLVHTDTREIQVHRGADLPSLLRAGDLVVVNDAATLPASLTTLDGELEFRLTGPIREGRAGAVAFGRGSWRMKTEDRPPPRALRRGEPLAFPGELRAHLDAANDDREVVLHFENAERDLPQALYRAGRPVQYSYLTDALELWDVQTIYAGRPWAAEAPSAGFVLTFSVLKRLLDSGVRLARVTHAAGLSSTGDTTLDRKLPLPEWFDVPEETVLEIAATRRRGGRVIAVGTSVVRAIEGAAELGEGRLTSATGITSLRVTPHTPIRWIDGLLTGVHEPTESHFDLMGAFIDGELQQRIGKEAAAQELEVHEFGDACLLLPSRTRPSAS